MSPELLLGLVVALLILLIAAEVPVAFSLLASGAIGLILLKSSGYATNTLANQPFATTAAFSLVLVPMFVIMGMFVVSAGIAQDVYAVAARTFRRLPGGLGIATVAACAGFAAVTGSSAATVATIGRISIAEMRQHGYRTSFAAGIVGASGTLGILIPPSLILVIYGTLTGESIEKLLLAGVIPGVFTAVMYSVVVFVRARKEIGPQFVVLPEDHGAAADTGGGTGTGGGTAVDVEVSTRQGLAAFAKVATLFLIVVVGIYSGLFTATESGAIAAFAALLMLVWTSVRRREVRLWPLLKQAFEETTAVSTMIFMLLIGGGVFTFFMVAGGYARDFAQWVTELPVSPHLVVVIILLALIPLGMILDGMSILLITVPLTYPVVTELGFDGIWFGILVVKLIEIGLVTPPVGINCYVVAGSSPGVRAEDAFRGVAPFVAMDMVTTAILFAFPIITLWLPNLASV
ncbi:TRAP transporter large permease [Pseudonocardia sp. KRD-184]|uniref:TRAP transporter large permease n=1 Tax=Pseudonocardia oceani TaxID=2792013 RepID=A0ABS6UF77_9PSEU|nr:TRAP transporter large permease [Pseudonocardia oceani]MBW0090162.1 TRAP transporter large permease [Pseudonocardia oceani]MBW0097292.1 TRAP transporter large permease [Pseudonocardia oceani]MBW0109967.1 TRAP transporter large permease [Pseudonocardia oceani]MBW0120983.1 TRAP transporter large permease [Pseudonocardia oceani]MBW0130890.1 TRAP transporter large permease [Pseudonocardia oceani]